MAIFAGMIMPAMSRALRGTSLRTTGEKLREIFDFAYASALSRRRPVVVNMDAARQRCWVSSRTVSLPWMEEENEPKTRTLASMELPGKIEFTISRLGERVLDRTPSERWETITFSSDGRTEDVAIELSDADGERFEIEIVGATGQVRVREEP